MTFIIEKNIPLPKSKVQYKSRYRDAMVSMDVGDSFFISDKDVINPSSTIYYQRKKITDKSFALKDVEGGIRVWRTA